MAEDTGYYYPVGMNLTDKICLIAGLGVVGRRKLSGLLSSERAAPKRILLFDPEGLPHELTTLPSCVLFAARKATNDDLLAADLVFACTSDARENARIGDFCRAHKILCNAAGAPAHGDIVLPATVDIAPITLTLSSNGASPALVRLWKEELAAWAAQKAPMAAFMQTLRPRVLALNLPQKDNQALFRQLAESPLTTLLAKSEYSKAKALLLTLLPNALHPALDELLFESRQRARSRAPHENATLATSEEGHYA